MEAVKDAKERTHITQKELEDLQRSQEDYHGLQIALANAELQKQSVLERIQDFKKAAMAMEKQLISRYGKKARIDIKTGEITRPSENGGEGGNS